VEIGSEPTHLQGNFNIVQGGAVAVVVDVRVADERIVQVGDGIPVGVGVGVSAQGCAVREPVLGRAHVEVAKHAHLHVLHGLHVAVVHERAWLYDIVIIRQGGEHVHGDT